MNNGRFFELNQNLSDVANGIAIYDYIDLPAYYGQSVGNKMSPQFPVSVTIIGNTVRFRLHYSVFKCENEGKTKYGYVVGDLHLLKEEDCSMRTAHMEEVILEIPYDNDSTDRLSSTLQDIYTTNFPQIESEQGSSGGRFLEQLIMKRYSSPEDVNEDVFVNHVEKDLYMTRQRVIDNLPSFSSMWLMDVILTKDGKKYFNLYDQNKNVVKFLRKLLLDYMFDLKHSDVFQNSTDYQRMYSGLMSNFYFSALMHKCEYYYYRKLTRQAIDVIDLSKTEKEKKIEAITILYADELIKAEDLWVKDIMNPLAEINFEYRCPKNKIIREIFEYYSFKQWPSWFAEPEEEMRRVCFTMRDEDGKKHICNADTLVKYLKLKEGEEDRNIQKMIDLKNENREQISRWFLRQYDFNDVLHLHWFKHLNVLFVFIFAIPAMISLFTGEKLFSLNTLIYIGCEIGILAVLSLIISLYNFHCNLRKLFKQQKESIRDWYNRIKKSILWYEMYESKDMSLDIKDVGIRNWNKRLLLSLGFKPSGILKARWKKVGLNIAIFTMIIILITASIYYRQHDDIFSFVKISIPSVWVVPISIILLTAIFWLEKRHSILKHIISSLHMFFPRLVASISLSWITLSMGFDLYVSYFDTHLKPLYISLILFIVMLFVMYEINRITPHASPLRKLARSAELMIISYFISLSVGFLIINFLGEKYLERGGYISDFYTQHVSEDEDGTLEWTQYRKQNPKLAGVVLKDNNRIDTTYVILEKVRSIDKAINDTASHVRLVKDLEKVKIKGKEDSVAAVINFWGIKLFVLRDFLIMFSFIAMFTGIFIQLIIFGDNKQMTEL